MRWRAAFLGLLGIGWVGCALAAPSPAAEARPVADPYPQLLREAATVFLKEGNARYVAGKREHPNQDAARRRETAAEGQEPFATLLACSDSREPVELIFDRGVGDLFVVRVAGNVAGPSELASLEYGVGHLHTPLVVVLGHSGCGAVTATVKGAALHGHLAQLAERIRPAAKAALAARVPTEDVVPRAIEENVWWTIASILRNSSEIRERLEQGAVEIVGALHDLDSGVVKWLGPHPKQAAVLADIRAAGASSTGGLTGSAPASPAGAAVTFQAPAMRH